jgi:hypothetical protein
MPFVDEFGNTYLGRLKMSLKSALIACLLVFTISCPWSSGQDATEKTEDVVVKLLDQGTAPRQTLRLLPKQGQKQSSLMKMKIDQTMVMKGQKLPAVPTPAIQFTIDLEITEVDSNGDITFEYSYPKVEIIDDSNEPSATKELMQTMLKSMEGLSGSAILSSRGFTRKSDIALPPNVAPQIAAMIGSMKDSMNRMSSPLHEEPVGVGGKWNVTQVIESNGMKIEQTSVHTLTEIKGNTFGIAIELTQSAGAQEIKTPGLPPGTTMTLKSLESTGKGKMLFDIGAVFPVSQIKSDSKIEMEMLAGGQTLPMQAEMTLELTVSPVEASDKPKTSQK